MSIDPTIASLAQSYKESTEAFLALATSLSADQLDRKKANATQSDWTARQVIHHMMDSESNSFLRLRRLIAEPGTTIQGYDEMLWANNPFLGYQELDIKMALDVYKSVREASYQLIMRLTPNELKNAGVHSESGEFTVEKWLKIYSKHPVDHMGQIQEAIA